MLGCHSRGRESPLQLWLDARHIGARLLSFFFCFLSLLATCSPIRWLVLCLLPAHFGLSIRLDVRHARGLEAMACFPPFFPSPPGLSFGPGAKLHRLRQSISSVIKFFIPPDSLLHGRTSPHNSSAQRSALRTSSPPPPPLSNDRRSGARNFPALGVVGAELQQTGPNGTWPFCSSCRWRSAAQALSSSLRSIIAWPLRRFARSGAWQPTPFSQARSAQPTRCSPLDSACSARLTRLSRLGSTHLRVAHSA